MQIKVDEIEITVPWGHIAGKIWGNQDDPIILVLHGLLDNAGSFDRLIPLLPKSFCYICIDFPGHGKSSHSPPPFPVFTTDLVIACKLLMIHFKREKYIILGHSYGAQIGFLFAQLYPEHVDKLIMLDSIHIYPINANYFKSMLRDRFDLCIALEEKKKTKIRPTYTYAEALQKLQDQRTEGYISPEAAEALLQRAITPAQNGKYSFTLDHRMKRVLNPLHDFRYAVETVKKFHVTCPVLIILARKNELPQMYMKPITRVLEKFKNIRILVVDGHHDVHNNNPEIVAPHVSEFLLTHKGKL